MKERIVGNWLTKASERSFQIPFAYMLATKGYQVVHISRHCAMELGKDILAINPEGIPCAFQLKGKKRIKLNDWRKELNHQVIDLTNLPIEHPSFNKNLWHLSYLVVNGDLEEEVTEAINKFNRGQIKKFKSEDRKLQVISYGELFQNAIELGSNLWPSELKDIKKLLEVILSEDEDIFPHKLFLSLLDSHFVEITTKTSHAQIKRLISSASLLTSLCCSGYTNKQNYFAEIMCWCSYLNKIYSIIETYNLNRSICNEDLNITLQNIKNSLANISDEVLTTESFIVGNPILDTFVYRYRMLLLIGLISINGLINKDEYKLKSVIFIKNNIKHISYWGESSISFIIPIYLFLIKNDELELGINLIKDIIRAVIHLNNSKDEVNASPYYLAESCLLNSTGIPEYKFKETFFNQSYIIDSLIILLVRKNQRHYLENVWPKISKIMQKSYMPSSYAEFFKLRSKNGKNLCKLIHVPTSWSSLKDQSTNLNTSVLPSYLLKNPIEIILCLLVVPQRYNIEITKILDELFLHN